MTNYLDMIIVINLFAHFIAIVMNCNLKTGSHLSVDEVIGFRNKIGKAVQPRMYAVQFLFIIRIMREMNICQ